MLEGNSWFGNVVTTKFFMPVTQTAYNADGSFLVPHPAGLHNTVYLAETDIYKQDNTRAISNSSISYDIGYGIKAKSTFAIDYNTGFAHQ